MLYIIVAILIIASSIIMYKLGKKKGRVESLLHLVYVLDPKLVAEGKFDEAFAKVGKMIMTLTEKPTPPQSKGDETN